MPHSERYTVSAVVVRIADAAPVSLREGSMASLPDPAEQVQALRSVVRAVATHNAQFSSGSVTGKLLREHIEREIAEAELREAGASDTEAAQVAAWVHEPDTPDNIDPQGVDRSILALETAEVLHEMGLAISPLRTTDTIYSNTGSHDVSEVRIAVSDGARFAQFITDTATPRAQPDDEFRSALYSIAEDFLKETTQSIVDDDSDRAKPSEYTSLIATGLKRHGFARTPAVEELTQLGRAIQDGYSREYVVAKASGVLETPGEHGFTPSTWHRDIVADHLHRKWSSVTNAIETAAANPHAQGFAAALTPQAAAHLDFAVHDWSETKAKYPDGYGAGFDDVFSLVRIRVGELEERFPSDASTQVSGSQPTTGRAPQQQHKRRGPSGSM